MVLFILGQSNVANTVSSYSETSLPIYNFYQGRLYLAKDPLLGATGKQGSLWIRTATNYLAHSEFHEIVLVNISRGNSSVKDWAEMGRYQQILTKTLNVLKEVNLAARYFYLGTR